MHLTRNKPDLAASLLYIVIGAAFALIALLHYPLGNRSHMGPGFFPFWLGVLLAAMGLLMLVRSALKPVTVAFERWNGSGLAWIIAAIALFIVTLPYLGLFIAVLLLITVSSRAEKTHSIRAALLLGVVASLFSMLIFVKGLGLLLPLWPIFLS
ncbi:tripartite tricarboxylate transporter TctB family protein [Erwiniaceae bacterium BAC15a-03b]|uniref:Tripartite tricarboxylate transporter TctB family protein n=1 Tax=Winslowiella arboricola TaxID=2978220 RepID=A0A9J6PRY0_9GAMM|nr:tripartite tricarboxylate transporter TctB family protein [Winslowiella arboricola]MCU5775679.1 tripartite tricarboxylate transporter TctB family protein [Winslowiella arboricola]MCU5779470.1 tripartite tricarboxylate transporter TctB family protein [Winslowiella arboricola]